MITSENKFIKIYKGDNKREPTLQPYYNFMPKPTKDHSDRFMSTMNLRNCPKNNRLLLQFNYPKQCLAKRGIITPYIGDNQISMNSRTLGHLISWMVVGDQGTKIFQFTEDISKLQEFDLAGIMCRQSDHRKSFKQRQILARGTGKVLYLTTPEADNHLEHIEITQIMESHKVVPRGYFNTRDIEVETDKPSEKRQLFDLMYDMKQALKCTFEFRLNDENLDILLACILPSGYLFTAFLIHPAEPDQNSKTYLKASQIFASKDQRENFFSLMNRNS